MGYNYPEKESNVKPKTPQNENALNLGELEWKYGDLYLAGVFNTLCMILMMFMNKSRNNIRMAFFMVLAIVFAFTYEFMEIESYAELFNRN